MSTRGTHLSLDSRDFWEVSHISMKQALVISYSVSSSSPNGQTDSGWSKAQDIRKIGIHHKSHYCHTIQHSTSSQVYKDTVNRKTFKGSEVISQEVVKDQSWLEWAGFGQLSLTELTLYCLQKLSGLGWAKEDSPTETIPELHIEGQIPARKNIGRKTLQENVEAWAKSPRHNQSWLFRGLKVACKAEVSSTHRSLSFHEVSIATPSHKNLSSL